MIKLNTKLYRELMTKANSGAKVGSYTDFTETPVSFKIKGWGIHYPKTLFKRVGDNIVKISLWSYSDIEENLIHRSLM